MILLVDLGTWSRITYDCACSRYGFYCASVGVNAIVFCLEFVVHLVAGWIESRAYMHACAGCESLSRLVVIWF